MTRSAVPTGPSDLSASYLSVLFDVGEISLHLLI